MVYYIDKDSVKVAPTHDPSIFSVSADLTTDTQGNDWEKTWTSVSALVNVNEKGSLLAPLILEYKKKVEKTEEEQIAITGILGRIYEEKNVKTYTRQNPNPVKEETTVKVEIVGLKEGVVLKTETSELTKEAV